MEIKTKVCKKCEESKVLDDFYNSKTSKDGKKTSCKDCCNFAHQKWKESNPEYFAEWRADNKDASAAAIKEWKEEHKERVKANNKKWAAENKTRTANKRKIRYKEDLNYRLTRILRARLGMAVINNYKAGSAVKDLGCSIAELKVHLESKFRIGMSWDNYGTKWHIDHIVPLASFDLANREQLLKACHYTNLQPLWAEDNLVKGDRISA